MDLSAYIDFHHPGGRCRPGRWPNRAQRPTEEGRRFSILGILGSRLSAGAAKERLRSALRSIVSVWPRSLGAVPTASTSKGRDQRPRHQATTSGVNSAPTTVRRPLLDEWPGTRVESGHVHELTVRCCRKSHPR